MSLRFVCKKCGYINKTDSSFCANCEEDLTCDRVPINIEKTETHRFFDYTKKEFCDKSPFSTQIRETIEKDDNVGNGDIAENDHDVDGLIKICPMCESANDSKSEYCVNCNNSLRLVRAVAKNESNSVKSEGDDSDREIRDSNTYSLVFGRSGENVVKITFKDNRFLIGRDYQDFLEQESTVSRKHCYIKRLDDNSFALFESKTNPSTNHTYVRLNGGRLDRVVPGVGYPLLDGTIFVLANKIPVLFRKEIC